MKKYLFLFLTLCLSLHSYADMQEWHNNKFSMFIHFGLYSELGGVWNGKQISYGYSEQIQAHGGIYSDKYAEVAERFNPQNFNADEIVSLAKKAGMRSIVITSKHHDGFCLFKTSTTDFNMVDATPSHRDLIRELSDACRHGGIHFGLYFSIIDWQYPEAAPITTHNATFITSQHHQLNLSQVKELVTNYGPISELWFDMGSCTPQQSKDLYDMVHRYQPECMVSGRLGNGYYDFAVMGDNYYPNETIHTEWQVPASMFDETWGYRSWQKRGIPHDKAMEKLRSLIRVVSNGGNYLLNIGPMGDGSVVPFEKDVLEEIGAWTQAHADALYSTESNPFRQQFEWGCITRKDNRLFLILSGEKPIDNTITLPLKGYTIKEKQGPVIGTRQKGSTLTVILSDEAYENGIQVVELTFNKPVLPVTNNVEGRVAHYSFFNWDYYTNYRSTINYQWQIPKERIQLTYTAQEVGKDIDITADNSTSSITLSDKEAIPISGTENLTWGKLYLAGPFHEGFERSHHLDCNPSKAPEENGKWVEIHENGNTLPIHPNESYYIMQEVTATAAQDVIIDVASGNGIELYLNGESLLQHLNPYRCTQREEKVLLHLTTGTNYIVLRSYNRFEKTTCYLLRPSAEQVLYRQTIQLPVADKNKPHSITIRQKGLASPHADTELSNLTLSWKK